MPESKEHWYQTHRQIDKYELYLGGIALQGNQIKVGLVLREQKIVMSSMKKVHMLIDSSTTIVAYISLYLVG